MTSHSSVGGWDWVNKKLSVSFGINVGVICEDYVKVLVRSHWIYKWQIIFSIFPHSKAHSIIDWFTSWWERRDGTAGVLRQWTNIGNKLRDDDNLTSTVFAPSFNLWLFVWLAILDSQNSATCFSFSTNYKSNKFKANRKRLQMIFSCSFLQNQPLGLTHSAFSCAFQA